MKPNTNEHSINMEISEKPRIGMSSLGIEECVDETIYEVGYKQGYAKALNDARKIIDRWDIAKCKDGYIAELKQEIAKLAEEKK